MADAGRFYITTPIYYVNDRPHIGHAYTSALADALARYRRLFGDETYFLTGTDEHGQKVQEAADKRGISPQDHCDELHQAFKDLLPELNIEHDDFIRTTEPRHKRVVQATLQKLYDAGDIYAEDYEGWYSTSAERFWTEKDLVDGKCPDSGLEVEKITERNYFFRMSKYEGALRAHIAANDRFIRPPHRANEVLGFLDNGLQDLCISRPKARLAWGIELPFDPEFVTYVWFDALTNYVSALGYGSDDARYDTWWPHAHHLIGKDILTTHAVYWTTMLLALEIPLPKSIIAHGWWLQDETKMSKSLGNAVSPLELKDIYGADVLRYFLLRDMVIGLDSDFSEALLVRRNNSDLANDLGNLARRAAGLVDRYFDGKVPEAGDPGPDERALMESAADLGARLPGLVDALKIHTAIEETMQFVRQMNKYVTDTAPFKLVKTDVPGAGRILYTVLEGLRHAAWFLAPVMPEKMATLRAGLGTSPGFSTLEDLRWGDLEAGSPISLEKGLFPRAEAPAAAEETSPPPPAKAAAPSSKKDDSMIDFDQFQAVELAVATVKTCGTVDGADKLLIFELDLGDATRTVLSGLALHYDPETLVGTQVILVANLAPRKIFGIESQGMLLTTEDGSGGVHLLRPGAPAPPGTSIQ
jgi:methionyl-tRNA synthetase